MENDNTKYGKEPCAALAFHKSLIGLSQLNALETAAGKSGFTQFLRAGRFLHTMLFITYLLPAC